MNPNEPYGNVQNTSEDFGSVLKASEDFSNLQNTSKRTGGVGRGKKYPGAEVPDRDIGHDFLIMEEAYSLFESEGERRSVRMIAEYCKTGELVCVYDSDDKRWHITRESVAGKIEKIKSLNARKAAIAPQSTSEQIFEAPATPHRTEEELPPRSESAQTSTEDRKTFEQEIIDLKILNAGKDLLIDQLRKDRTELITRIETSNRRIGRLKSMLLQLMPGQPTKGNDPVPPPADRNANPAESNVYRDVSLVDNTNENYEHSSQ
jgi:hypothetical protein